jgi:hypothetical protein
MAYKIHAAKNKNMDPPTAKKIIVWTSKDWSILFIRKRICGLAGECSAIPERLSFHWKTEARHLAHKIGKMSQCFSPRGSHEKRTNVQTINPSDLIKPCTKSSIRRAENTPIDRYHHLIVPLQCTTCFQKLTYKSNFYTCVWWLGKHQFCEGCAKIELQALAVFFPKVFVDESIFPVLDPDYFCCIWAYDRVHIRWNPCDHNKNAMEMSICWYYPPNQQI